MAFLLPFLLLVLPSPTLSSQDLHTGTQRASRGVKPQPIKVIITDTCAQDGAKGREVDLDPDSPLVLTHQIRLVPGSGQGCGQCEVDIPAMRERIERLEKELSDLREKCGGPEGCCTSQQSKGAVCTTVRPTTDECPDDCNDQGRCVDGKCVCFQGYSGPDCSTTKCPDDCNNLGKCVNGQCVCDPGFSGPDCSTSTCPDNCSNRGRCVNGRCVCNPGFTGPSCQTQSCPENCNSHGQCVNSRCVCDAGFTGPDCSEASCPENCNNRGRCVNGQCVCNPGFTGPDCSVKTCPENCSNHGRCVQGKCVCESGFTGPDCSSVSCPGNCNSHGQCVNSRCVCDAGFTGPDCSEASCPENCNNRGRCVNGQCVCNPGFTGPDCSVKTCPENCSNHGRCVQGKCVCESGFTGPDCSSVSCPGNCNSHGQCVNSRCVCDAGFTGPDCSEASCPENCNNRGRCVNGQCVCNPGFTGPDCSVKTCPENCSNHGRCVQGKCVCESGFTGPDCSSVSCPGNCNNHGRCVKSRCVCDAGFTGRDCSEASCPKNCKNRGRCVNGQCVCNPGFTGPDCSVKTCPENCSNHGRCVQGKCVCESGFTGPDCSSASCPGNCNNHGRCVKSRCVCDAGFTGRDCSEASCPENCKNRGRCVNGQCVCNPGFTGPDCSVKTCPENCSNHGRCVQGKCVCESGFTGPDCSSASCPGNCNNHGRCVKSRCVCDAGFTGRDCSEASCPENCKNRGRCVNGQCVCNPGFTGPDCSVKTCPENCSNHGRCVQGKCVCESGFTGPDCSSATCPGNCNNHGRCVKSRCVCDAGFTGRDCSEASCPENCKNRGRCVNGQCVCNPGFTGPDCSVKTCPENCSNHGRCVQGKCVCESGFTGPDCSSATCPGNCNNQGRCVDGRCVCESGFTGQDCSSKACPSNCNNKGRCVNGKCVCDVGFAGQDCSAKTCPKNCSNRGRCMRGHCICLRGFTGSSCSECESGLTGDNCDIALLGVSHLSTREITESSVSLFWTQPAVQYDTYHITFTSMKESNQNISSKISGRLTTYIQTGLATGQEYMVSLTGEKEGMMGAETTAKFNTLISGPKDLQVVKTATRSVVVKWEKAQGEIDRYVLSVTPNKTSDRLPEVPRDYLPPERDSAQIDGLEPGNLYDISLVAEKDSIRSLPASVQATPGNTSKPADRMTMGTVTMPEDANTGNNERKKPMLQNTTTLFLQKQGLGKHNQGSQVTAENPERKANITERKPGILLGFRQRRPIPLGKYRILPKPGTRPDIIRTPLNSTRIGLGGRRGVAPSLNKSVIWYPVRPKSSDVDLTHPISGTKPISLMAKETRGDEETHFRREHGDRIGDAPTSPTSLKHTATSFTTPQTFTDSTEEPTVTTEKNLTVYINGKKCVRKVLVGYRKIHGNTTSEAKNLTVIVGHVHGNDLLHRLLTDGSIFGDQGVKGLDESQPTAETSEARRSVKEKAGKNDIEADEKEEIAGVINISPSSARQAETTLYPIFTTTSLPHLHTPPYLTQPERVNEYELRDLSERPPGKEPLSIQRQPSRARPLGPTSTALEGRPFKSTSSFVETQKEKRPSSPNSIGSGLSKEARVEKEQGSQASTPEPVQNSPSESSSVSLKAPLKKSTGKSNEGPNRLALMPFQRKPFRDSLSRRPFVSTFQNRSRQILSPPQYPSRGSIRRPMIRNNRTISSIQQVKPAITTAKQNSTSDQIRPNVILNMSNGTAHRLAANRMSQLKHSATTQIAPNISEDDKGNSDIYFSTDHPPENDNKPQEYTFTETNDSIEQVRVNNVTSNGFVLKWGAPKGKFEQFIITHTKLGEQNKEENDEEEEESKEPSHDKSGDNIKKFTAVLPGSARLYHMINLRPQTRYYVSIFGKGPAIHSKTHNLTVRTGPEPPSNLAFSDVTDSSFTVSWAKPKSKLSGFKITYTHVQEDEPISISVDSETVRQTLSPVSPGSTYEVRVMSVLGRDESDSIKDTVTTLPDPPTDLRAINITDGKALLLWRPALATIDHYIIMYSSEKAPRSGITIKVSGNAAEQQLQALQASTEYRVTLKSQLRDLNSSEATAVFTTSSGAGKQGDGPQDLKASQVTPRTAVLSWKPPNSAFTSYKLSYYTNGQDIKEVILDPTIKEYKLSRLYPMSKYTAHLQVERGGLYMTAISTEFTTGNLRFPFPTDCSQERQNGELESGMMEVFPQGKQGEPVMVYCDMETDGGGWTVFQRRKNGKTNFFRSWREYSSGFGELDEEFWLGNEHLHNFTIMRPIMLRVDLKSGDKSVYAQYSSFSVDSQKKHYAIKISGYSGTAGDSLTYHDERPFSTRDRDPLPVITRCAMSYRGGWWYKNCHEANLNGLYNTNTNHQGVIWTEWKGKDFSIPFTEMKFRPASFKP